MQQREQQEPTTRGDLREQLTKIRAVKLEIDALQEELSGLKDELRTMMAQTHTARAVIDTEDGVRYTASVQNRTTVQIDEEKFIQIFGRRTYNKYAVKTLSREKVENAVSAGTFGGDANDLTSCLKIKTVEGIITLRESKVSGERDEREEK